MANYQDNDQIQGFIFENMPVRGTFVRLHASYQVALSKRPYPPAAQYLLGDALVVIALLTHTIKLQGALALQVQGEGPVTLLLSECTHDFHVRGLVHHEEPLIAGNLLELFGKGLMAITMKSDEAMQNYQGVIPLVGNTLAHSIESYFAQSEQLPTRFYLAHDNLSAVGLMLQTLPGHETSEGQEDWNYITTLADTLKEQELLNLSNQEILHRLFHQDAIRLFDSQPVSFRCSCSRSRMESVLLSLGEAELKEILKEYGAVDTFCEFCNHHYTFDPVDIHQLLADPGSHTGSASKH